MSRTNSHITACDLLISPCCGFVIIQAKSDQDSTHTCSRQECMLNQNYMSIFQCQSFLGTRGSATADIMLAVDQFPVSEQNAMNSRYMYLTGSNMLRDSLNNIHLADGVSSTQSLQVFSVYALLNCLRQYHLCEQFVSRKRKLEEEIYCIQVELKAKQQKLARLAYDHDEKHVLDHKGPLDGSEVQPIIAEEELGGNTVPSTPEPAPTKPLKRFVDTERN